MLINHKKPGFVPAYFFMGGIFMVSTEQQTQADVWDKLSAVHDNFGCDKYIDHTRIRDAYNNLKPEDMQNTSGEKTYLFLELAETSILKAVDLKRRCKHFEGQRQEYEAAVNRVKEKAERASQNQSSYYFLNVWYHFYLRLAERQHTGREETRYMINILFMVAAQCIAYYRYLIQQSIVQRERRDYYV
jgi:hypothetical protein